MGGAHGYSKYWLPAKEGLTLLWREMVHVSDDFSRFFVGCQKMAISQIYHFCGCVRLNRMYFIISELHIVLRFVSFYAVISMLL